ncbi:ATP-dependent DNA helicase RecQ [Terriglobus sp. TAA 43]|uniref:RecQ family ATP-dependent DNA helicase n=1 Tax=Terriglobus sp. TAA 43 TaxID=278961 RepID=UPI00064695F3|nr:ATP-dependent DNA helicase RecQ [Terriglobus sp. TAA 43]
MKKLVEETVPWDLLKREAKARFGIAKFRSAQRETLEAVMRGRSVLAIMPTGAGKSLTYQLPALLLPHTVVVVSPLIALMQDQKLKAEGASIEVSKIDSTLTKHQREEADEALAAGIPKLLYVTPERLENPEFLAELKQAGVSLFVVDEAHTIAQWGHDFRPAYLGLRYAREALGNPPVLALTATATEDVIHEILEQLNAKDAVLINAGSDRTNLFLAVHPTVNNDAKLARLMQMLANLDGTGIVYTASVRSANELYERFKESGIASGKYHGKMTARERERAQAEFMNDTCRVMVATKAFGLGIDKPNIRFVFHYEFPDSLESYYQEAGRAGRDGDSAQAVLLYRLEDRRIQSFFAAGRYPRAEELRAVLETLSATDAVNAASLPERAGIGKRRAEVILYLLREMKIVRRVRAGYVLRHAEPITDAHVEMLLAGYIERSGADRSRLDEMMQYAETVHCRMQVIRRYFNEDEGALCGKCDNCVNRAWEMHEPEVALHGASQDEGVTRIETLNGPILTTAPETLPQVVPVKFQEGVVVRHKRFGRGRVRDVVGDTVMVQFEDGGCKRLKDSFLKNA